MARANKVDAVDARVHHRPLDGARLVAEGIARVGTQAELAARCGVTREYLRLLSNGERRLPYVMQVTLEQIAG